MGDSKIKQWWRELTSPLPSAPGHAAPTKAPSGFGRLWNALKPPPAVRRATESAPVVPPEVRRRQRTILVTTLVVAAIGAGAWGTYLYIASAPMRAEKIFRDGMRYMGTGKFKEADTRFTRAIDTWPSLGPAYLERGLARENMNQGDAAIDDFERALSVDSNLAQAHTELGLIYRDRGDLTRAVNEFSLSLSIASTTDALFQRGQLYESLGQHEKALADYDAAIHEQPDAPHVYRARAMTRAALGDDAGAAADRERANYIEHH